MTDAAVSMLEAIERYAPDIDVPPPAVLDQARRNLEFRVALLREFGAVDAATLAELAGSSAKKPATTIDNWKRAARVVAVRWHGRSLVPGFQLLPSGEPDPLVQPVLRRLRAYGMDDWQQAIWWTVPAPALDGRRPVDVLVARRSLDDDDERAHLEQCLLAAAQRRRDWF